VSRTNLLIGLITAESACFCWGGCSLQLQVAHLEGLLVMKYAQTDCYILLCQHHSL